MSHSKERAEKVCLNCGALLHGRYCHQCGQENVEPKESVGHLIRHFFEDITHFDGKFFKTIKLLITKPGFLTSEYLAGHRARYLHPIRMYMFISFVFFFVLLTFFKMGTPTENHQEKKEKAGHIISYSTDSVRKKSNRLNSSVTIDTARLKSIEAEINKDTSGRKSFSNQIGNRIAKSFAAINNAKGEEQSRITHEMIEKFLHFLPQMIFVIMPFFALFLYLLYIRRRKDYNYVAHAIFTVHYYCFLFIGWLFILLCGLLPVGGGIIGLLLILGIYFYLYKAMRKFYKQRRGKTILKFLTLNMVLIVLFFFVGVIYLFAAAMSVAPV